jgi:hypothetical protein
MKFRAVILLSGKSATGIRVPEEVVAGLGSSKRPSVQVTIGGYTYRSTVASMGGHFMIPVSAEHRAGAGVAAGDEVEVNLELDTEAREIVVPADFSDMLERHAEAKHFFNGLSYSNKRRIVTPIMEAKTADTRQRRIEKALNMLIEGRI